MTTQVGQVSVGLGLDDAKFKKGLKQAEKQTNIFAGLMKKALGGIALGFTVDAVIKGINKSVEAFREQDRAIKAMNTSLRNAGVYSADYTKHLQNLSSEIQEYSNYGDEAIEKALSLGQAFSGNIKLTDELIKATVDYAAATGQDLESAFTLVGKSIGTSTNALARYGVNLDKSMSKTEKMAIISQTLGQRFSGSARDMADKSTQLKNAIGDLSEEIGHIFNPAVEGCQSVLINFVKWLKESIKGIREFLDGAALATSESNRRMAQGMKNEAQYYRDLADKEMQRAKKMREAGQQQRAEAVESRAQSYLKHAQQFDEASERRLAHAEELRKKEEGLNNNNPKAGTDIGSGGLSEASKKYQTFVEEFEKATIQYNATLKARNYVQKTLGLSPVELNEDYEQALQVYTDYYAKVEEITRSNASNKANLLKMAETKLQQDLQNIALQKTDETQKKQWEIVKSMQEAQITMENNERAYQDAGGFLASFSSGFEQRLQIEKDYWARHREIENTEYATTLEKQEAYNTLAKFKAAELAQAQIDTQRKMGHDIYSIFESSLSSMLTNYGDFGDNMKQMCLNLINYMLKQELEYALKSIQWEQMRAAAIKTIRASMSFLGGLFGGGAGAGAMAMAGAIAHSGHSFLPVDKHHYGGNILPTADQTEHLTLIKNNERVLNPSETAAYNNNQTSSQPNYIVFAPQVQAMNSRDVASWFNENKQQIISIVSSGIKNNEQGIKTQIQGV